MLKAKDIMTENVLTVKCSAPIYDAIQMLVEHQITGLPVVDDDGAMVGVISEKDMLKELYDVDDKAGHVEDFMTRVVTTFDQSESVLDICNCFIKSPFRRVPILDNGKVVGIISRADIINYILKLKHKDVPQASATGGM
jgi:CBS domain-containing protein